MELSELPPHEWDADTCFCIHCGVPEYAVVDGLVIPGCGVRAAARAVRTAFDAVNPGMPPAARLG